MYSRGLFVFPVFSTRLRHPARTGFPHTSGPGGGIEKLAPVEVEPQLPVGHHPQMALTHRGEDRRDGDSVWGEVLELHPLMEADRPPEAARRSAQAVAVELGKRHYVALGRPGIPVVRLQRDPLRRRQGGAVAQESLPLKLQQPVLRHRRRAPVVGGDESHRHLGRKDGGFATA